MKDLKSHNSLIPILKIKITKSKEAAVPSRPSKNPNETSIHNS